MGTIVAGGLVEQAADAAAAAAARAAVEIHQVGGADDARRVAGLLSAIWAKDPGDPLVAPELIRSLAHADAFGATAEASGELVGAALGFYGHDRHGFYLHSYIAGVRQGCQGSSVGFALKQHQRAWALARGLTRITWTFDPLVRRNAYFNLVKLGADVVGFERDFYGAMTDGINGSDLSDRVLIEWRLDSARAVAASKSSAAQIDPATIDGGPAVVRLRVGADDTPEKVVVEPAAAELVQIPDDIVGLRRAEPDLARRWRLALRDTLGAALATSARVDGFTRDGWYVVRRDQFRASP